MELDPLEWPQIALLKDGSIEPMTIALYAKILRPGDTYIDVGAHVGFHTLVARYFIGGMGTVIAVDPQPYNCQKIMTNWRANAFENVFIYVAAIGEQNGSVVLHDQSVSDKSRLSLCLDPVNDEPVQFRVPLIRLDDVLKEHGVTHVRLLKIDVEGYEPEVLAGLGQYSKIVENIILEVLGAPSRLSAKSLTLVNDIKRLGYSLRTVDGKSWTPDDPLPENNLWVHHRSYE